MAKEVKMEKTEYVEEKAMGMQEVKKLDNLSSRAPLRSKEEQTAPPEKSSLIYCKR